MERNGINLNREVLEKQSDELKISLDSLQERIYEIADEEFNIGSPKQLQSILYDKLKLPILKKPRRDNLRHRAGLARACR